MNFFLVSKNYWGEAEYQQPSTFHAFLIPLLSHRGLLAGKLIALINRKKNPCVWLVQNNVAVSSSKIGARIQILSSLFLEKVIYCIGSTFCIFSLLGKKRGRGGGGKRAKGGGAMYIYNKLSTAFKNVFYPSALLLFSVLKARGRRGSRGRGGGQGGLGPVPSCIKRGRGPTVTLLPWG